MNMLSAGVFVAGLLWGVSRSEPVPFLGTLVHLVFSQPDRNRLTILSPETEAWVGDTMAKTLIFSKQNQIVDPNDPVRFNFVSQKSKP
jgi:hypothetical protein